MKMFESMSRICDHGLAGVHLGAGLVHTVSFRRESDGRISFTKESWRDFHTGEQSLQVGTTILVTIKPTRRLNLHFIFVFNII